MVNDLRTPAFLVDMDILERNIKTGQQLCDENGKQLWPMVKTHKSTTIAKMQLEAGAAGFLCGTLDECEALADMGVRDIMYAYPVATQPGIDRVIGLAKRCGFILRLDNIDAARLVSQSAQAADVEVKCCIIIDSGLHRFGIMPEEAADFARRLAGLPKIGIAGIATHPGHVYGASRPDEVQSVCMDEAGAMKKAAELLREAGFDLPMICSGSTPTFTAAAGDSLINILHPGNYVFNDVIQLSLGSAAEGDCALTVLASIISRRDDDIFLFDAGTKCLGLDQGAHGNSAIKGFGVVKGHPEATVISLSEEVGKLRVSGETKLNVGDKIEIIPNHSCVPANMTSYLWAQRGRRIDRNMARIPVDIRGNSV